MSRSADLYCVHPDHLPVVWPAVRNMLRAAYLKNDLAHTQDLEADVLSGNGVLWLAATESKIEAAAVAVLTRTDANLVCNITACGGVAPHRWVHMLAQIEAWAKAEGASKMRLYGRKGWKRILKGYHIAAVVMERTLV